MPNLRQLWQAVLPQARPLAVPDAALDRAVGWVRILKPRVPAFDALEADDLAIAAGSTFDSLDALGVEPASVVEAVARAGGSGMLLVGQGLASGDGRADVAQQAAGLGLALLHVDEADISALERSAIAYIVTGQAELERRVAELEAELEQAALAGTGMPGLAAIIARFLARPVSIEGPGGEVLAVHAPPDAAEDGLAVARYLQRRRGEALRRPLPVAGGRVASRGRPRAALVLLGSGPPSELDSLAARRVAGLLALELGRVGVAPEGKRRTVDRLPTAGPPWVAIVARQVDQSQPATLEERERVRHALQRSEPASRLVLRGDATSVELRLLAAAGADDGEGIEIAGRVARLLARPVAVSRPFADPAERPTMEAQARVTLEALEALAPAERRLLGHPDGSIVGRSQLTAAYRLLAGVRGIPDGPRQADALLGPLLTGQRARDERLLATLRAVLDHPGLAEAAAALGIHRNTLAYRLQRIERRAGWRLSDPTIRFTLALAVRLVQIEQEGRP